MEELLAIETKMGRLREGKWKPRIIDLDLLLYDKEIINQPDLIIPHMLMHERWFVLKPLAEIAHEIIHPVLKKRIRELFEVLPRKNYEDN